jgi:two-component system OmpR family sensor kinase
VRRPLSLRARITLVTIIVAVLAVLVTGLVSLQLVRSSSVDQARAQLAAQATILSKIPAATNLDEITQRVTIALGDTEAGIVTAQGAVSGPAAELLPPRLVRRARLGLKDSTTVRGPDGPTFVEIRHKRGGGSLVLALPRNSVDKEAQGSLLRVGLALLIGLAVAVIAGTVLARWLARPLVGVARTAHRIARGERGIVAPSSGPAEVVDVSDALAVLDTALASSEARQREFLLSISHELRTPLTALRGYAEALSDGMVPAADLARVGDVLVAETTRLDHFVADLLELARLEADDFSIATEVVDVPALLRSSREVWLGRAASLGVTLVVESSPIAIRSDPRRLRQIVDGLVENALRVSPEGSTVRLAGIAAPDGILIEVRDGGPGLSPEDAAVAFERGVLRERYRDSRPVGTGLGLSIAARLASRLGGSIRAGTAVTGGAVFTVTLPPSLG